MDITYEYFKWLISYVNPDSYLSLMKKMFDTDFTWTIYMDKNRAIDGLDLRTIFSNETGLPCSKIFEDKPVVSVLEVLVGLARRIENDIMYGYSEEDQTSRWFWIMMENLGLELYSDELFDEIAVEDVIARFLDHRYSRNGYGSIFWTEGNRDFRRTELWYQTSTYFNEHYFYKGEENYV